MSRSFLRREWGAVTFVLTVALGIIVVPLALIFGHGTNPANAAVPPPVVSPSPSPATSPTPGTSPSPAASPSPAPSPSPTH